VWANPTFCHTIVSGERGIDRVEVLVLKGVEKVSTVRALSTSELTGKPGRSWLPA
jgi:hypothetical protein